MLTVKRSVEQVRGLLTGLMLAALTLGAWALWLAFQALSSPDGLVGNVPPHPLFMFALAGIAGGLLDARMLWAGQIQGAHRLARHLWRMGFATWIATTSFFIGEPKAFPDFLRQHIGLRAIPVLVVDCGRARPARTRRSSGNVRIEDRTAGESMMGTAKKRGRWIAALLLVQLVVGPVVNFASMGPVSAAPGFLENAAAHSLQASLAALIGLAMGAVMVGLRSRHGRSSVNTARRWRCGSWRLPWSALRRARSRAPPCSRCSP